MFAVSYPGKKVYLPFRPIELCIRTVPSRPTSRLKYFLVLYVPALFFVPAKQVETLEKGKISKKIKIAITTATWSAIPSNRGRRGVYFKYKSHRWDTRASCNACSCVTRSLYCTKPLVRRGHTFFLFSVSFFRSSHL